MIKKPNYLKYKAKTDEEGLVVFSEVYYPQGWVSLINGVAVDHFQVNYILRGMEIPRGEHVIEFIFDPKVVKTGCCKPFWIYWFFTLFYSWNLYKIKKLKKVLIVTYYWPPAGGPGVQRWLKFANNLTNFDFEPHVLVPKEPNYAITDNSLEKKYHQRSSWLVVLFLKFLIFSHLKIISTRLDLEILIKSVINLFLKKFFFFSKGKFIYTRFKNILEEKAVKFLRKYLQKNQFDTIITTGPPHSIHLIGLDIKKEIDINWIADFRDPWFMLSSNTKFHFLSQTKSKHLKLRNDAL